MTEHHFDLVVCGGGVSGIAAAAAAGRKGLYTALIEEDETIGGTPVDCRIQVFCSSPFAGIRAELCMKMAELNPESAGNNGFRLGSYLTAVYSLLEGLPVTVFPGQRLTAVTTDDARVEAVSSDRAVWYGKAFLDATGNGDIAAAAGLETRYGRESWDEYHEDFAPMTADRRVQLCTQMFTLKRFDGGTDEANFARFNRDEYLIWGPSAECPDTADPEAVRKTREELLARMPEIAEEWLKKGFFITDIAPKLGVRESRRIVGAYTLSYPDVISRRRFDDSVTIARYLIDPWELEGNPFHSPKTKERCHVPYYEIPYRCLFSEKRDNLWFSGRCISTTHVVNSSCRVMPICMSTGQAAGTAAALAVRSGCSAADVPIRVLQDDLRAQKMLVSLDDEPDA